ncbi:MAG: sigma-70 family RNA polymerase sigma factor [Eubacterium sp.]|nr:sigma-70 family RNA polymerase sigma factor [Eubacterium sp.]
MENLVRKARNGDADAFIKLMRLQQQNLYRTSRAILSNEEDAADAISETVLTCWEKMKGLKKDKYFRTWMTRILINKCNDILRKKEKLLFTEQIPEIETTDEGYQNAEWIEVLQMLEEKYRLVVILYYVDGFRTTEISRILDVPVSTVCTQLARARKILADNYCPKPEQHADRKREGAICYEKAQEE